MAPPRILLCGDVFGTFNQLFKRVSSVNKSAGPFDALLCVGQFFPDSPDHLGEFMDYIEGRSQIPLPTYFIGDYGVGSTKILLAASRDPANQGFRMEGLKVCRNLFWLKGSGKFNLHGLSVAYLSGRHSSDAQQFGTYSEDDVGALRAIAEEPGVVDIFLTNEWPSGVSNRASASDLPHGSSDSFGYDPTIAELVAEIKPRYHIAGTKGVFYAREPYSNTNAVHVTRFLGLASVGNKVKQKFIHAISPAPASTMSTAEISMKLPNTTLSPYLLIEKSADENDAAKRSSNNVSDEQYWRYDVSRKRQKHGAGDGNKLCFKFVSSGSCPRGDKCNFQHDMDAREQSLRGVCFDFMNKGKCERGPDCSFKHSLQEVDDKYPRGRRGSEANRSKECWFCLSSPNIESHLVISVGENYYCALAKGPLVQDHVLIVPVEHSPSTLSLPSECETELARFQGSLKKYHNNNDKEVIFFEWTSKRSTHTNLQAIPVPSSRAAAAQKIFNLAAEKLGFKFVVMKFNDSSNRRNYLRTQFDRTNSFFYVEFPDGAVMSHLIEENERFPAQFGREVLAGLLNMADKADWRNCTFSKEEETKMVESFKNQFQKYDPNE